MRAPITPEELRAFRQAQLDKQAQYEATHRGVPPNVVLGPLSASVVADAHWDGPDQYPAWQKFADEFESLLNFAKQQNQYDMYFSRLISRTRERDAALDELRIAHHFLLNNFEIIEWHPKGLSGKDGEYLVSGPAGVHTFVEVKGPTWQSELTEEEQKAGRTEQYKYQPLECRAVAPWQSIQFAIDKAYYKLSPTSPNLLVISGHHTFVNLCYGTEMHANEALYTGRVSTIGYFTTLAYCNLGGVGIFWHEDSNPVSYRMKVFPNPYALIPLNEDFLTTFPPERDEDQIARNMIPL